MPSRPASIIAVAAALLGLAAPPGPAQSQTAMLAMPLCSGSIIYLAVGGRPRPDDRPRPCHAQCAARRGDDEDGAAR
jgi:hypothetical protein